MPLLLLLLLVLLLFGEVLTPSCHLMRSLAAVSGVSQPGSCC